MRGITATVILGAALAAAMPSASSAKSSHVYTETETCRSIDLQQDEFVFLCKGPGGLASVLHYFDGVAMISFGKAGGDQGDEIDGKPFNSDDEPIRAGWTGAVFGPKIEWSVRDGVPCAATVRVLTENGSRLVVTSLAEGSGRAGVEKTNEGARAKAEKACDSYSAAGTNAPDNDLIQLDYQQKGPDDPVVQALWGDVLDEAEMPGGGPVWAYVAEVDLEGGRKLFVSQFWNMIGCGARTCPMSFMLDGKVNHQGLVCSNTEYHQITKKGDVVMACDVEMQTGIE